MHLHPCSRNHLQDVLDSKQSASCCDSHSFPHICHRVHLYFHAPPFFQASISRVALADDTMFCVTLDLRSEGSNVPRGLRLCFFNSFILKSSRPPLHRKHTDFLPSSWALRIFVREKAFARGICYDTRWWDSLVRVEIEGRVVCPAEQAATFVLRSSCLAISLVRFSKLSSSPQSSLHYTINFTLQTAHLPLASSTEQFRNHPQVLGELPRNRLDVLYFVYDPRLQPLDSAASTGEWPHSKDLWGEWEGEVGDAVSADRSQGCA